MEKVFHFDSPQEVYKADALVISCFDARFDAALRKFLKRRGVMTYDHVKIPGGPKALGAPDQECDRDFVCRMIGTSIRLHQPERAILLAHNECGAYPGVPIECVSADVVRAVEFLRGFEPSLAAEAYFHDFDGVYRIC